MRNNFFQPWVIRKILYGTVSIALAVAVAAGVIDTGTAEQWLSHVGAIAAALGSAALAFASAKTGQHSDPATTPAAEPVVVPAPQVSGAELAEMIGKQLAAPVADYLGYILPGVVQHEKNSNT